jgi:hypothetical protein
MMFKEHIHIKQNKTKRTNIRRRRRRRKFQYASLPLTMKSPPKEPVQAKSQDDSPSWKPFSVGRK